MKYLNRKRYFEIEENSKLTDKQKSLLHKIEDKKEIISFWNEKKNVADYHINQNNEKIKELNQKLEDEK